jgi:hypothetical protein
MNFLTEAYDSINRYPERRYASAGRALLGSSVLRHLLQGYKLSVTASPDREEHVWLLITLRAAADYRSRVSLECRQHLSLTMLRLGTEEVDLVDWDNKFFM